MRMVWLLALGCARGQRPAATEQPPLLAGGRDLRIGADELARSLSDQTSSPLCALNAHADVKLQDEVRRRQHCAARAQPRRRAGPGQGVPARLRRPGPLRRSRRESASPEKSAAR
ncbi:MAG TPA: hypothetical protein VIR81_07160 [Myxococcales bacterium]